jgi:hypothetical protein
MNPPFTSDEFFAVFAAYNSAVWPAQWLLFALALGVVAAAVRGTGGRARSISISLALLWAWMSVVYHWSFFRSINPAASLFAGAFLVQAALLLWMGLRANELKYRVRRGASGYAGSFLVGYALIAYPIIGVAAGQAYPELPTFGLPCPTTIFTIGALLWSEPVRGRWSLFVVPTLWTVVASSAVFAFGVVEDVMLPLAIVIAGGVALWERRHRREPRAEPSRASDPLMRSA